MAWKHSPASLNRAPRYPARFCSLQCFGRIRFRGTLPSRRHSSVRLHSEDSLGTGAAYAASVACAEEALLRREAASEAKPPKGPRMSHAKRCADKGVASEGRDPKTGNPRGDLPRLPFSDAVLCMDWKSPLIAYLSVKVGRTRRRGRWTRDRRDCARGSGSLRRREAGR